MVYLVAFTKSTHWVPRKGLLLQCSASNHLPVSASHRPTDRGIDGEPMETAGPERRGLGLGLAVWVEPCHVPWGRRVSPIVRFELPDGEARGRAVQLPGWRRWRVELRGYQDIPFDFAARLCCPPREPLRWRTPGLTPVDIYADEPEYLSDFSMETTEDRLLRWLLRHEQTRDTLEHLQANCGA